MRVGQVADRGFDGFVGEVLVYDRELSEVEVGALDEYLQRKWKCGAFRERPEGGAADGSGGGARGR